MTPICPPTHKHGKTHTCYNAHGCRCAGCRKAKSKRRRPYEWEARRRRGQDVWEPATGTMRRLRALAVMGWSIRVISDETGLFWRSLGKVREGKCEHVHMATWRAVSDVFEQRCMTRNTTREGRITATHAQASGWLPPLAWDNPDTDRAPRGIELHEEDIA